MGLVNISDCDQQGKRDKNLNTLDQIGHHGSENEDRCTLHITSTEEFHLFTMKLRFQIASGHKHSVESCNTSLQGSSSSKEETCQNDAISTPHLPY